jgi:hypothetical protein
MIINELEVNGLAMSVLLHGFDELTVNEQGEEFKRLAKISQLNPFFITCQWKSKRGSGEVRVNFELREGRCKSSYVKYYIKLEDCNRLKRFALSLFRESPMKLRMVREGKWRDRVVREWEDKGENNVE